MQASISHPETVLSLFDHFFKIGPAPTEGLAQVPTELMRKQIIATEHASFSSEAKGATVPCLVFIKALLFRNRSRLVNCLDLIILLRTGIGLGSGFQSLGSGIQKT